MRKRDIERRFLQRQGYWAYQSPLHGWLWTNSSAEFNLTREQAFRRVVKNVSPTERRLLNRLRRAATR